MRAFHPQAGKSSGAMPTDAASAFISMSGCASCGLAATADWLTLGESTWGLLVVEGDLDGVTASASASAFSASASAYASA